MNFDNNINFDESSREWRKNKINLGKGCFHYKCEINECKNELYCYTTQHKQFSLFATDFDLLHKNHINKTKYCEEHLLRPK